jgi:hypothetical protein
VNWIEKALSYFGADVTIHASGRWALCTVVNGVIKSVYLCSSESQAKGGAAGIEHSKIVDLAMPTTPHIRDNVRELGYD